MVLTPLVPTQSLSARNLQTPLRKRRRSTEPSEAKGTWLLHDLRLEQHAHPRRRHAECPERIRVIFAALERAGLVARCRVIACRDEASDELLGLVHSPHYLQRLKTLRRADGARLEAEAEQFDDVYLNEHSIACARLAVDGVVRMAEALWAGTMHNGLALVRPAGHHAGRFGPSGFCLLNSLAVAARRLLAQGCQRVLIIDWDVHHGDGTQQAFLAESRVLTFSVHRRGRGVFPFGGVKAAGPEERGEGKGAGRTVNLAWDQAGMGDAEYAYAWDRLLLPLVRAWRPQAVLVSAGFDAAAGDPLGEGALTPAGFGRMTRALAQEVQGRLLLALEGGYSLTELPRCAAACVRALLGEPPCALELAAERAAADCCEAGRAAVHATLRAHAAYWPGLLPEKLHANLLATPPLPTPPLQGGKCGAVTREAVNRLPDFAHLLPSDYRSGYIAWRRGNPRGAKGELRAGKGEVGAWRGAKGEGRPLCIPRAAAAAAGGDGGVAPHGVAPPPPVSIPAVSIPASIPATIPASPRSAFQRLATVRAI